MQPSSYEIKAAAKTALKNHWTESIGASFVLLAVACLDPLFQYILMSIFKVDAVWTPFSPSALPSYNVLASISITVFSAIYTLFVIAPLFFGVFRFFWNLTAKSDCRLAEIFYYFGSARLLFKAVGIAFGLFWRVALGALLCLAPSVIVHFATVPDLYNALGFSMPVWLSGLSPLVSIFRSLGLALLFFWVLRYSLFYIILFSDPKLGSNKTIKRGSALATGQVIRLIAFSLSFFGWLFLCILIFPFVFVAPYVFSCFAIFGREEYRLFKEKTSV